MPFFQRQLRVHFSSPQSALILEVRIIKGFFKIISNSVSNPILRFGRSGVRQIIESIKSLREASNGLNPF
jgi:hypothetical protein